MKTNRRTFLGAMGAAGILAGGERAGQAAIVRPRRLRAGDTIGLITPATPVSDPEALQRVTRTVEYFGLRAKWGRNVARKSGYFGNPVEGRLEDLHQMFRDPEVAAVMPIRGGYGAPQLLDRIDYDLIRRNPKVFVGYSDITALHLAIHQKTGLVTFHGPNIDSRFTEYTIEHYRKALFEAAPLGAIGNPRDSNPLRPQHTVRAIRPGKATGRLIGGNLTLISTTMGTPWEIDTRGAILLLEDIGEEPYRIDRMLTQLRLAGKLQQAAGIVFGECADCAPSEFRPFVAAGFSLGESLDALLGDLRIPVLFGLTIGHTADQLTLPLGIRATLDTDKGTLTVEESGVN
ncbi:MAG: LD-carboxypeptidase [Blastocatellia bacterium]|nr:LD-carboxypeptidase [Blastocatellia bacterium]